MKTNHTKDELNPNNYVEEKVSEYFKAIDQGFDVPPNWIRQALTDAIEQGEKNILNILNQQHPDVDVLSVIKTFISNKE